jgi:hypothetical protein
MAGNLNKRFRSVLFLTMPVAVAFFAGCATSERVPAYQAPLTSVGARFGALPSAVQNSIRAETGAAQIRDIDKEFRSVGVVYKVTYVNEGLYPPLFVATDGSVINPDMSVAVGAVQDETAVLKGGAAGGIQFHDLPPPVVSVIDGHAARSQITSIDKQTWGSRVVYTISFKDETKTPKLYIAADGTILRDVHK